MNERQLVDQLEDSITRLRSCLEENRVQETIARPDKVTARLEKLGCMGLRVRKVHLIMITSQDTGRQMDMKYVHQ